MAHADHVRTEDQIAVDDPKAYRVACSCGWSSDWCYDGETGEHWWTTHLTDVIGVITRTEEPVAGVAHHIRGIDVYDGKAWRVTCSTCVWQSKLVYTSDQAIAVWNEHLGVDVPPRVRVAKRIADHLARHDEGLLQEAQCFVCGLWVLVTTDQTRLVLHGNHRPNGGCENTQLSPRGLSFGLEGVGEQEAILRDIGSDGTPTTLGDGSPLPEFPCGASDKAEKNWCVLEAEHIGAHQNGRGVTWWTEKTGRPLCDDAGGVGRNCIRTAGHPGDCKAITGARWRRVS